MSMSLKKNSSVLMKKKEIYDRIINNRCAEFQKLS